MALNFPDSPSVNDLFTSGIDANYVRANRIPPTSLSGGGSSFSKTTGGSGYGVNGGGIIIDASHSSMLGNVNWPEKPTI